MTRRLRDVSTDLLRTVSHPAGDQTQLTPTMKYVRGRSQSINQRLQWQDSGAGCESIEAEKASMTDRTQTTTLR